MDPKPTESIAAPASTLSRWFRQNGTKLLVMAGVIAAVCYFFYPADVLLAGLGLSLIIFIHELGHFLAAKFCDVHVKTFSIGFGPPLPFCSIKRGETTYKIGMIPLGGYVAMIGEGDARQEVMSEGDLADAEPEPNTPESDPDYPRSFKNKSVPQRMLIISAGVIMNILLAGTAFVVAYLNGVEEQPAIVQSVDPGSAAWRVGVRPGSQLTKLNSVDRPWFDDIRPSVNSTRKGETVDATFEYKGTAESHTVEPLKMEGALFPQLGIAAPQSMTLLKTRRDSMPPFDFGSAAANAKATDGSGAGFQTGDRIVAMTDPSREKAITPLESKRGGLPGAQFDFRRRLVQLAGQEFKVHVLRKGQADDAAPTELAVPGIYRKDTGLRMKMGPIAALRLNSPAAKAGLKSRETEGDEEREPGDIITAVQVLDVSGKRLRFSLDPNESRNDPTVELLDPLRLPLELNNWADRWSLQPNPNRTVSVTVQRFIDHRLQPVTLDLAWDHDYREDFSSLSLPGTPVPLGGLGLAYRVSAEVNAVKPNSPAKDAGIRAGDVIAQVRFKVTSAAGKVTDSSWDEVERNPTKDADKPKLIRWAFVDFKLQVQAPHTFDLKIHRDGQETEVLNIAAKDDATWPVPADGWFFGKELRVQKAENVGEALEMGFHRTVRAIRSIYQGLYGMVIGRISVTTMSGPITLARASYILAGEDSWKLILLIGLISVNLAVVNFLPIPVLDGGHMVFLLYELFRRKPAPESVQVILTWIGLGMVLCLMVFTIGLDIWRLIV